MKVALLGTYPVAPHVDWLQPYLVPGVHVPKNFPKWNVNLATGLAKYAGCEVQIFHFLSCLREDVRFEHDGVVVWLLATPRGGGYWTVNTYQRRRLAPLLAAFQPDVVHGHGTEHAYAYLAATSGFPHVITVHNLMELIVRYRSYPSRFKSLFFLLFEKYVFLRVRHAIFTTPHLRKSAWLFRGTAHIIYNSIGDEVVDFPSQDYPKRPFDLVYVGYIRPEKNIETLLHAVARLRPRFPALHLRVVGSAARDAQDYLQSVHALVTQLGLKDCVEFVGHKTSPELERIVSASTALVLPSHNEAFGLVLVEAMALGTPPVSTRAGGVPWVIDDGENGLLFDPSNVDQLVDCLGRLLDDPALHARLRAAGLKKVREVFSIRALVERHQKVYAEVLADAKRAP